MSDYYPVYLNLSGKLCVIFGGGGIAEGKIAALLQAGSRITLISPTATPFIEEEALKGSIEWKPREYQSGDLAGAFLAISATNQREVNELIFQEAEQSGILLNSVDDTPLCTFIAPSITKRGPVTIAISTGGVSPALARKLRETLAKSEALEWADLAPVLARARKEVKDRGVVIDPDSWQTCITPELLKLAQSGQEEEALKQLLSQLLSKVVPDPSDQADQCQVAVPHERREELVL